MREIRDKTKQGGQRDAAIISNTELERIKSHIIKKGQPIEPTKQTSMMSSEMMKTAAKIKREKMQITDRDRKPTSVGLTLE